MAKYIVFTLKLEEKLWWMPLIISYLFHTFAKVLQIIFKLMTIPILKLKETLCHLWLVKINHLIKFYGAVHYEKININYKLYSDKQSSFETLLEKDGSASVHNRNLQILATEMHKIKNDLSPLIVTELFEQRNEQHYDLRKYSQFTIPPIRTVYHGLESVSFLTPKIWNILLDRLKNANSI